MSSSCLCTIIIFTGALVLCRSRQFFLFLLAQGVERERERERERGRVDDGKNEAGRWLVISGHSNGCCVATALVAGIPFPDVDFCGVRCKSGSICLAWWSLLFNAPQLLQQRCGASNNRQGARERDTKQPAVAELCRSGADAGNKARAETAFSSTWVGLGSLPSAEGHRHPPLRCDLRVAPQSYGIHAFVGQHLCRHSRVPVCGGACAQHPACSLLITRFLLLSCSVHWYQHRSTWGWFGLPFSTWGLSGPDSSYSNAAMLIDLWFSRSKKKWRLIGTAVSLYF